MLGPALRSLLSACLGLAFGCGGDDAAGPVDPGPDAAITGRETVSFRRDLRPVLLARCSICHGKGSVVGYDVANPFDPEDGLINRENSWAEGHDSAADRLIVPYEPDESFLLYKVGTALDDFDNANNGAPMPLAIDRVTGDELSRIRQWIEDGAEDDAFFQEQVAPIFGTEARLGSKSGKCVLCHYPGSPTGLNVLAPFDEVEGLVSAQSGGSKKLRVAKGAPDDSFLIDKLASMMPTSGEAMPLHYPRLSDETVEQLRTWIAEGAKDN